MGLDCRFHVVLRGAMRSSSFVMTDASWSAKASAMEAEFSNSDDRRRAPSNSMQSIFYFIFR